MQAAAIAHPTGDVYFVTPNEHCEFRVRSFFDKEPDTIEWLAEINPGEVYIDVGANVGMYAIWAAKTTGARVVAFEPESQNFALLNLGSRSSHPIYCTEPKKDATTKRLRLR